MRKEKMKSSIVKGLIVSSIALGGVVIAGHEANAAEWKANTPDQIQIVNGQKEYTMKLGDTLWAIGQKINVNHVKLAEINGINLSAGEQYRLPVGRVISFEGNVATVKESNGQVVSQSVIQDKDKVDASKPAGEPVNGNQAQTPQNNGQTTTPAQPQTGNQDGTQATTPSENGGTGQTETPVAPTEPTTPVEPTEPSKPTEPETPVEPTEPEKPVTPEKDTTPINLGNSGMTFNSQAEAISYGESQIRDEKSKWFGYGFSGIELVNKEYEQLGQWTVDFYNPDKN